MQYGQTAGALADKAAKDETKYSKKEIAHELAESIPYQLLECGHAHIDKIKEDRYCVAYVIAKDPLIHNLIRRKFFAVPFFPMPRPNQGCWLYDKTKQTLVCRLWTLPNAETMAELSEAKTFLPEYREMKAWCDAFFHGFAPSKDGKMMVNTTPNHFYDVVSKMSGVRMPTSKHYLDRYCKDLDKSTGDEFNALSSESGDVPKILQGEIIRANEAVSDQQSFDTSWKAHTLYGHVES